jgi:hypothetical protein
MKRTRRDLVVLLSALAALGSAPSTRAMTWQKLMTQGKLAADLGDRRSAEHLFADLAADAEAPENVRAEAQVRLGVVERALGKTQASATAFQRAITSQARDSEVTRLLALALAGVAPDRTIWATDWPKLRFTARSGAAGPYPSIQWPRAAPEGVREAFPASEPVTFDLEDVALTTFLHHLLAAWRPADKSCPTCQWPGPRASPGFENWPDSYQPPAAVGRLSLLIHSAVQGRQAHAPEDVRGARVTVKASGMPWNEVFENVLASNGLAFVLERTLLLIARAEDVGAFERISRRTYGGPPISLHFEDGQLREVLGLLGDITWYRIAPDEGLQGSVTMVVAERPAMEVLDLVLAANDLAATRIDAPDAKPGRKTLRIQRLADVRGEAVDLSRLVTEPPVVASGSPFASFASFAGAVQVKKAGTLEWISARNGLPLNEGDIVRTGSGAGAEIQLTDGLTTLHLRADSCITVGAKRPSSTGSTTPSCP